MTVHYFPLSLSQQNILDLERALPGSSVNNICTTVRIRGYLDYPLLQESIHRVMENDDSIRIQLTRRGEEYLQYHAPYSRMDYPVYDFSGTSREGIENWEIAVTREPFRLEDAPLYRFCLFRDGESSGGVLIKLHHIISDGWSQVAICNRIGQTYLELLEGKQVSLQPAPDYELHVQEEQEYLTSRAYARDEAYWKRIVEDAGEPSVLKSVSSAAVSPVGRRMSFDLPQVLNHAIYAYCMEKRIAPFAVFYMALAIYFKRIGGADRFTIGVPIFNRTNFRFKQSTGMFVTTLPFYNEINDTWNLDQFNESLMESWYEMLRHQRYPFGRICDLAGREGRLFHIALSYQDSKIYESRDASVEFSGRWHYCGYQMEQLTIHLTNLKDHRQYAVDYDYLAQFFDESEIRSLHANICEILNEVLSDPERPIHRLRVLSLEQKEQLLYTFNQTDRYLEEMPVYEALVRSCAEYQSRAALICNGERTTYGALLYKSAGYAGMLTRMGVVCEDLVAVMLPRNQELFAAMIGTLQAGAAYLILSEELPNERIRRILQQSGARVLITGERGKRRLDGCTTPILTVEEVAEEGVAFYMGQPCANEDKPVGERLAYVVYTSGSTGEPKGVEITQRNLLNLAQEMRDVYGQGAVLSVCNVGFDAFMLESIVALLNGRTIVLPGDAELEAPDRLAALIRGYAVGFVSMTPSRLAVYLQDAAFARAMRRMESIVCGGEAFPVELLKKLKKLCNARIYNQYGPSETTVGVSLKELSRAEHITAGRPMGNCRLYVLDKWMNPLPVGGYGHLYVGGKCVGRGYRNRPELTEKSFRSNPFVADDRIYSTGDLATWTADGEIVLTGRTDDQVKLRGLRVELGEISACIEAYPGVTMAAARIREIRGQQVIGVYYCAERDVSEVQLLAHAATYLPQYMIPSFAMHLETMPVNANGKIDEKKLPLPEVTVSVSNGDLSETGRAVLEIFRAVLHREDIAGDTDYFMAGGNSLNAMECIMRVEERTGRKLRIADMHACRTAARLAALLDGGEVKSVPTAAQPAATRMLRAPRQDAYALSSVQQGIYIQSLLDPSGLSYNMPGAFLLDDSVDIGRLERALELLVGEEPLLRTCFVQSGEGLIARVEEHVSMPLERMEASNLDVACCGFLRGFDLGKAPLMRAAIWQSPQGERYLFLDSHHIVGDGMSTPLLLRRLECAYRDERLSVEWNYYDYLHTLHASDADRLRETEYWKEHLRDLPEVLTLPGDFQRPKKFDFKGSMAAEEFSDEESKAFDAFCQEKGISSFALFLAAYGLLLARISGREDFVIGAPVAGRLLPDAQDICGPFINTLPLRMCPERSMTATAWLERVQSEIAGMLDHQRVSLEEIIAALKLPRSEQNALYQVMITQSPVDEASFTLGGKPMAYRPIDTGAVKMDLIMEVGRKGDTYALHFSYASSLFAGETIAFYGRCMRQILDELMHRPDRPLDSLRVTDPEDQVRYVDGPNYRVTPFSSMPIHRTLHARAQRGPEDTAVIFRGESVSYARLERRAAAIASFLAEKEARPGSCVGLCLSRTPDMIAAMYAVLQVGCAYVFLLPSFPEARFTYMLKTAGADILLYDTDAAARMAVDPASMASVRAYPMPEGEGDGFFDVPVGGDSLVNVLYTSGSTGRPKGVMLRHRSVSNLYAQMCTLLDPIPGNVLCSTNSIFDCFIVETLIALAMGRTVVLADEEEMMLPWKLAAIIENHNTGITEMTPSRLQMCLGNDAFCRAAARIRIVLLGGEVVTQTLSEKFYSHTDGVLMNMYGPTEATVFTTMGPVRRGEHITIGRPLQNTRTYVLSPEGKPVMPTACGELYIAGECLAAGYIGDPERTGASFVDDVFFPGEKMYRSGDLVRLRLDGEFDYIGRKDAQVKLNGQRVELGEIVGAIQAVEGIRQAAVVPVRREDGSMELCAFCECGEVPVEKETVEASIRKVLPPYMVPSRMVMLDHIPLTDTNKIDMQRLKTYAEEGMPAAAAAEPAPAETVSPEETAVPDAVSAPAVPCRPDVSPAYVLSVWNRVLSIPATDENTSFFTAGGTSIGALNVMSHYFNDGLEMTLAEFYENQTASAQADLLASRTGRTVENTDAAEGCHAETAEEPGEGMPSPDRENCILVTGATGFFGAHLVKKLISGSDRVICLIRGEDPDRLFACLAWYFGQGVAVRARKRIEVVCGDIAEENLGLSAQVYASLAERVTEIYHAAADVRHYAAETEDYLAVNSGGTANMLALARAAGAAFYYMSTCSVSGDHLREGGSANFTEMDYDIGQIWEENIYVRSKYLAEGQVMQAMTEGLRARIFRLGRLVGRASDGVFQQNPESNVFYLMMQAFRQLGAAPMRLADDEMDLIPVDTAVEEVLLLKDGELPRYHIVSHTPPTFRDIIRALDADIRLVDDGAFSEILENGSGALDSELAAIMVDHWHRSRFAPPVITVDWTLTRDHLRKMGYVQDIPAPNHILQTF